MDEARYRLALIVARAGFRRVGRRSIDGREPHDLAMQSLHLDEWCPRVVWCDILDAYRRERGRRAGRRIVGLYDGFPARQEPERPELRLELKDRTEVLLCELLAAGFEKQEAARVIGVTPTRVGQILGNIRKRNPHADPRIPQRKESQDGP